MNIFKPSGYAYNLVSLCTLALTTLGVEGCHQQLSAPQVSGSESSQVIPLHPGSLQPDVLAKVSNSITQESVMRHINVLSDSIGSRPAGSAKEKAAADYIAEQLEAWGYQITYQPFTTTLFTEESTSSLNVIATRPGDERWLIVGGHMDSIAESVGAIDNASGVAALLETARILSQMNPSQTLVFIGFGAEEWGNPSGSEHYVKTIEQTDQIVAMLNIDAIGGGRYPYVHAGATVHHYGQGKDGVSFTGGESWVRELSLQVAKQLGHEMRTAPAAYWDGYTGSWSDHYAFVLEDIPVAYFEAWDWHSPADDPWWGQETVDGDLSNTSADTLDRVIPEQVEHITEVIAGTAIAIATHTANQESQP